jgi:hypothetical protein
VFDIETLGSKIYFIKLCSEFRSLKLEERVTNGWLQTSGLVAAQPRGKPAFWGIYIPLFSCGSSYLIS